jgi:hypothetical protein
MMLEINLIAGCQHSLLAKEKQQQKSRGGFHLCVSER